MKMEKEVKKHETSQMNAKGGSGDTGKISSPQIMEHEKPPEGTEMGSWQRKPSAGLRKEENRALAKEGQIRTSGEPCKNRKGGTTKKQKKKKKGEGVSRADGGTNVTEAVVDIAAVWGGIRKRRGDEEGPSAPDAG